MHADPVALLALWLALILASAKLAGDLMVRLGQPAVLGELIAGIVLGNLHLLGVAALAPLRDDPHVEMLARLGALVLLFEVGLESTVSDMLRVGLSSLLVSVLGVLFPALLGYAAAAWLLPAAGAPVHAFLGATLASTSIGITARILRDLGASQRPEARIVLGASVIDDVLGLVLLAVLSGALVATDRGGHLALAGVLGLVARVVLFLGAALALGVRLAPRILALAAHLKAQGVLLAVGLIFCFLMAYLANVIGLASLVGAFAAGLILEPCQYRPFTRRGEHPLEDLVRPISSLLVPIFFVQMIGMRTDLRALGSPGVLGLAALLTLAAVAGKLGCGLGALRPRAAAPLDRLSIGIGMLPRGEVSLLYATVGLQLTPGGRPVISRPTFSAVVIVVLLTTMMTPPLLKWSLGRVRGPA